MRYSRVPALFAELCSDAAISFRKRSQLLFDKLNALDHDTIALHIEFGGVIPEAYAHDSSEE